MSREKYASAEDNYKTALGARIRLARGERTQEWLADTLRVSLSRVSEWEGGKKEPRAATLKRIVAATGCDPAWLLTGDERSTPERVRELVAYHTKPQELSDDAWWAIRSLLPMLQAIYTAREMPAHADRWGWISGNIKTFYDLLEASGDARRHLGVKKRKAG